MYRRMTLTVIVISAALLMTSRGGAVYSQSKAKQPARGAGKAAQRLNVLFLFADDMRADSIGALGNPTVKTPNLDALVRRGFVMTSVYCLGGNVPAVCTPSRNMLLSGKAYFRWRDHLAPGANAQQRGMLAPGDAPNFPLSMKEAGYVTYHHGKRGNTAPLIQAKFEINKYLASDEGDRQDGEPGRQIVDEAIAFLKGQGEKPDARPFFMYLAFANPHDPRVAAKKYLDLYDRDKLPLPKNYLPAHPFDNGEMAVRDELLSPHPRTEAEIRRTLHEYYATITGLDFHLGRLLETLKSLGLADDTIIIFSADQGIAVGSHGLLGKQNLYDHSMKAPLLFAGPGIPKGKSDALGYLLDGYPTVCELVGAPPPQGIDGVSFKPVIAGKAKQARAELMLAYRDVQRAYRDQRWKLIRYPRVDVTQLFDLQRDPDELRNLASDPAHAARVAQLTAKLGRLQKQFGDDLPLGTSGRNILRGPGFASVDFGLDKEIPLFWEGHKPQFRAEFCNLFNRVNFNNPINNLSSAQFGRSTSSGDPRVIQFGLKYAF